jgi:hypothetical protein
VANLTPGEIRKSMNPYCWQAPLPIILNNRELHPTAAAKQSFAIPFKCESLPHFRSRLLNPNLLSRLLRRSKLRPPFTRSRRDSLFACG